MTEEIIRVGDVEFRATIRQLRMGDDVGIRNSWVVAVLLDSGKSVNQAAPAKRLIGRLRLLPV